MKRPLALCTLVLAAGLVADACSSKIATSFDPRTCALQSACSPTGQSFGSTCEGLFLATQEAHQGGLGLVDRLSATWVGCVAHAADCASVNACSLATPAQAALCTGSAKSVCSGDVLVGCSTPASATDCAAAGASCFASGDQAICGIAPCDAAHPPGCDGDLWLYCLGGALQSMSCASYVDDACPEPTSCNTQVGNTCAPLQGAPQGQAICAGSGPACDPDSFPSTCDGTVIQSCTGGRIARLDCAQYGLTCQKDADGSLACGGTGTQCNSSTPESCDGSVLTYCWLGAVATLDCKQYGLSGCTTTTESGQTWARCTE